MTENNIATPAHRNVFDTSTWGNPELIANADAFIARAEQRGHFPVQVVPTKVDLVHPTFGSVDAGFAVGQLGVYADGSTRALGINSPRYKATSPAQWRELIRAAVAAGAKPIHSHAWSDKVVAQFQIDDGSGSGISTNLVLGDSFNGSTRCGGGVSATRLGCANQLAARIRSDWMMFRHTASLEQKINQLVEGIAKALEEGRAVVDLFKRATQVQLTPEAYDLVFDRLFPEAAEDASGRSKTIKENKRIAARVAAAMHINNVGNYSLATLWNAATYLVDRDEQGNAREVKGGGDRVGAMCFGDRGRRIDKVRTLIEVIMADGRVEEMSVANARAAGIDDQQLGAVILEQMLNA